MSLPKLTAFIGENSEQLNEFAPLVKSTKKLRPDEQPYIVSLVFDLSDEQIYFKLCKKLTQSSHNDYYYFGNNSAASLQYYLTRETSSIKYLLKSVISDLYQMLKRYEMENGELGRIIKEIQKKDMVYLANKKGEGTINLEKLSIVKENTVKKIVLDEKDKIKIDDKPCNPDDFIRLFIKDENKKNKFVLAVPMVRLESGEEVILSTHPEYLELVRKANNLTNSTGDIKGARRVCYVCKRERDDVSSNYSKKFDRTGINKIFTTTTINTSPYLQNCDYDNVYSICNECYQKLLAGEKIILKQFKSAIAGENVFIIPEGTLGSFDYNYLNTLKKDVDLAFKTQDANEWFDTIEIEQEQQNVNYYSINFIFYRTDGNSVTVLETIEDVPTIRFKHVNGLIGHNKLKLAPHIKKMSLGSIYSLIPVRTDKSKVQLDIGRVLSLYKAILSSEKINHKILYGYAIEALDKGLKQLYKSKIDNYFNMSLTKYTNKREDFFIKKIIFGYLLLFSVCQDLGILDYDVFKPIVKEDDKLNKINTPSEKVNLSIAEIEKFLDMQGFDSDAKALFYLGILVNRVAVAQMNKEHKTKPILKKIQFQGMNEKEVYRLYQDVAEKLRQYDRMTLFAEAVMNRFHLYFGSLKHNWSLNEHANVFYIMAGYAYMVGTKAPDLTKEEERVLEDGAENMQDEE